MDPAHSQFIEDGSVEAPIVRLEIRLQRGQAVNQIRLSTGGSNRYCMISGPNATAERGIPQGLPRSNDRRLPCVSCFRFRLA